MTENAQAKPVIEMRDITKIYHIGGEEVRALDHATLTIREGEFVAIIGPSGSGKSTLMNIMGCLDTADSGEYLLDGQQIEHYSEDELARIRNRKIGFVFQSFNLIDELNVYENQGVSAAERRKRSAEVLRRVGLESRAGHKPTELSGGQQQRVAVARALATEPALILADEPTGNLDSKTGKEIMSLFCQLNEAGKTIILITHSEAVAQQAHRRIRIMDGHVRDCGDETDPFGTAEVSPEKAGEDA